MKALAIFFALVLCFPLALALGVSPAKVEVDFVTNLQQDFTVSVINNNAQSLDVAIYADGPHSSYVRFPVSTLHLNPNEYSKSFTFSLSLPKSMEVPGFNDIPIVIKEVERVGEGETISVGSSINVISLLRVKVPYPGRYATASLIIPDGEPGSEVVIAVEVNNLGKEDIKSAKASVNVIGSDGVRVAALETDEKSVSSISKRELVTKWVPSQIGTYKAVAVVNYDGSQASASKEFNVGNFFLRLLSVTVKNFKLGGIAKFDILLQNVGSEIIKQTYVKMALDSENKRMMDVESNRIDINSQEMKVANAYWDTEGISKGIYYGLINLIYHDKSSEKKIKMTVKENSLETEVVTGMVVAETQKPEIGFSTPFIVISLLVISSIAFFYFKKRFGKKKFKKAKPTPSPKQ